MGNDPGLKAAARAARAPRETQHSPRATRAKASGKEDAAMTKITQKDKGERRDRGGRRGCYDLRPKFVSLISFVLLAFPP